MELDRAKMKNISNCVFRGVFNNNNYNCFGKNCMQILMLYDDYLLHKKSVILVFTKSVDSNSRAF